MFPLRSASNTLCFGKRVHEIIGIFKLSRKETLWCSDETTGEIWNPVSPKDATAHSRDLLARGTLWITSLGLGLTLRDGLVSTVHLCDPAQSPRTGTGRWTKEQQLLSEVRELPAKSTAPNQRNRSGCLKPMLQLVFIASLGVSIWYGLQLPRRYDAVPDVPAIVVTVLPITQKNMM